MKRVLRQTLRLKRDAFVGGLTPLDNAGLEALVAEEFIAMFTGSATVAGYMATGSERPVLAVLERATSLGCRTALPQITTRDQPMRFLQWGVGDPLEPGPFGLSQPRAAAEIIPDLVLTPLLGFDRAGGRLGQGAGYYDRWFATHPAVLRIGIAWSVQEVDAIPVDPWDIPLHAVITEREWIGMTS